MAIKKRKKFPKKKLEELFKTGNYQKVISKVKQYEIEETSQEELDVLIVDSYLGLIDIEFHKGEISRAIRDVESLLKLDDSLEYQYLKLKCLCYMENFESAVTLGKDLIGSKGSQKLQKEIIFTYLMASLYYGNDQVDMELLAKIPASKQNYILGFSAFLHGDRASALEYFKTSNPRSKEEKENLKYIEAIIKEEEIAYIKCELSDIKPLYRFLMYGSTDGLQNTKNTRSAKQELKEQFANQDKSSSLKKLLNLQDAIPAKIITKNSPNKETEIRLIYNNIIVLAEQQLFEKALHLFISYRNELAHLIESASLLIMLKNHTDEERSDKLIVSFFSKYLKLHHGKIAPFQMDFILISGLQYDDKLTTKLAQSYERDAFVFFFKELTSYRPMQPDYQERFDNVVKKYSEANNMIIHLVTNDIEVLDQTDESLINRGFFTFLPTLLQLFLDSKNPHKKYKESFRRLFKVTASIIQNLPYSKHQELYQLAANVIERYIEYFDIKKIDLEVDIKALFISISKEKSIKKKIQGSDDEAFEYFRKMLFSGMDMPGDIRYNFNEAEFNISVVKNQCIQNLKSGRENPFAPLIALMETNMFPYRKYIFTAILDLSVKIINLKIQDTQPVIDELYSIVYVYINDVYDKEQLATDVKSYAKTDPEVSLIFLGYFISKIWPKQREYVWFMKWLDVYINIVLDYNLKQDDNFKSLLEEFLRIQKKKNFKTMRPKYNKVVKKIESHQGGLF